MAHLLDLEGLLPDLALGLAFRTVVRVVLLIRRILAVPWFHQGRGRSFAWRGWCCT